MLAQLRPRSIYDVMAAIACVGVLAGGTAYAANTIRSSDIVDNEVYPADVRNDNLSGGGLGPSDLAAGSVTSSEVRDDSQGFGGLGANDLGPDSVGSSEVAPDSLVSSDIFEENLQFNNTLIGSDICNGCLNDEDVSQGTFVNFAANIGSVLPGSCVKSPITGVNGAGDHLLLTPSNDDARGGLIYSALYSGSNEFAWLETCNPATVTLNDDMTHFNLLVFDAR